MKLATDSALVLVFINFLWAVYTTLSVTQRVKYLENYIPIICHHDDVIKWKHFPCNWPFVREVHRSLVNFPHKGQWRGALMFALIYAWISDWVSSELEIYYADLFGSNWKICFLFICILWYPAIFTQLLKVVWSVLANDFLLVHFNWKRCRSFV